jgi:hypothetical protein
MHKKKNVNSGDFKVERFSRHRARFACIPHILYHPLSQALTDREPLSKDIFLSCTLSA